MEYCRQFGGVFAVGRFVNYTNTKESHAAVLRVSLPWREALAAIAFGTFESFVRGVPCLEWAAKTHQHTHANPRSQLRTRYAGLREHRLAAERRLGL